MIWVSEYVYEVWVGKERGGDGGCFDFCTWLLGYCRVNAYGHVVSDLFDDAIVAPHGRG